MVDLILTISLVIAALWSIISSDILKGAIALAITSIIIALIMFSFDAPIAGVFELSVCAGLITVVFISAISLTRPLNESGIVERRKYHLKRYWPLPVLAVIVGVTIAHIVSSDPQTFVSNITSFADYDGSFRNTFWNERSLDIFGQIIVIMTGIFGVVVLFKRLYQGKENR